jgi:LysM repeat protein
MAKHRAPRYVRTKQAIAGVPVVAGATVVGLGVLTSPAQAAGTHDWTGVAQCESGGDWSINTGNGYYGGLQFSQSTWTGYGGAAFAPRADLASPAEQVQIAEKVLAGQGIGAWPTCGKRLTQGGTSTAVPAFAPAVPAAQPAAAPAPAQPGAAPAGSYTVQPGDTLGRIAAAHGEPWQGLYARNVAVVGGDPNRIVPGMVLALSGPQQAALVSSAAPAAVITRAVAAPAATTSAARIVNSAGPVKPQAQAAANAVVSDVPGAAALTIGGTRASAVDPNGHPSGLALDYMVGSNQGLGDAIVQYQIANWDRLGVSYVIWQQRILTSPTGTWTAMEDRGSATANHRDHVHVNYRA